MTADEQALAAEVVLGEDAEEFLASDLGRFIAGRCDQEIALAHEELESVDPHASDKVMDLQNRVWRARSLKSWFVELIQAGVEAKGALNDGEVER